MNKIIVLFFVLSLIFVFGCQLAELDPTAKFTYGVYKTIKKDDKLRPFLHNDSILEGKLGTNSTCTDSIYGEGDGCMTWQDCADSKCVPEPGKCEKDEDCPNGLKCKGYHDCR